MYDKVILFPYYLALKIRNAAYNHGICKAHATEIPSVSIGNVTVGGTGKTPHTEMIIRMLQNHPDWHDKNIAVLSRGYKRKSKGFQQVTLTRNATFFGDEPVQIKKKFPGVTVALDKDRIRGCDYLIHPEKVRTQRKARRCLDKNIPAADIVILDDALQYRKLKPTFNIVLVDYNRPVSKDKLLPFGSLRDLPSRLGEADVIIVTKCPAYLNDWDKTVFAGTCGVRDYSSSSCIGLSPAGKKQYVFFTGINYCSPAPIYEECDVRYVYSKRIVMFTGIAKDTPLRTYLCDKYQIVDSYRFPDHHKYTDSDIRKITASATKWSTAAVVTTEKDAQRVIACKKMPPSLRKRLFQIPIEVGFLTEEEKAVFTEVLFNAIRRS